MKRYLVRLNVSARAYYEVRAETAERAIDTALTLAFLDQPPRTWWTLAAVPVRILGTEVLPPSILEPRHFWQHTFATGQDNSVRTQKIV